MTHQNQSNVLEQVLELLRDNGDEGYAQVLELILNQAMLIERSQVRCRTLRMLRRSPWPRQRLQTQGL